MRRLIVITIALSLFAVPSLARDVDCDAAAASTAGGKKFVICHATEEYLTEGGDWKQLDGGATIRVPAGKTIVEVRATNTAVFDYKISSEPVEVPEAQALKSFLKVFGPYVTSVLSAELETAFVGADPRADSAQRLRAALERVDALIDDLRDARTGVLRAYGEENAAALASEMRTFCGELPGGCPTFFDRQADQLLEAYGEVSEALDLVVGSVAPGEIHTLPDAVRSLLTNARKALDESEDVLGLVRNLERTVTAGLSAESTWTSSPFPITLQKGRKVTLKITPRPIAAVASAGGYPKMDVAFTLLPQWKIRPAVGLSLLWADGATYPTFGTSKTSVMMDGMAVDRFEIVEKDLEDRRATYGLDLGLTSRALCSDKGNCPWLDVIVNPSDDVRALGLGASYNFGILKLGGGVLWTKHKELDGQSLGDLLEADGDLKTRDSYSGEEFFVSISVIGWQPFVKD